MAKVARPKTRQVRRPLGDLGTRDIADPSGLIERALAQRDFLETLSRYAPDAVTDLYRLEDHPGVQTDRCTPSEWEDLLNAVGAWSRKWNIAAPWVVESALMTLQIQGLLKRDIVPDGSVEIPRGILHHQAAFLRDTLDDRLSAAFSAQNGWPETAFMLLIPPFSRTYIPTRNSRDAIRREIHKRVDEVLDLRFVEIDNVLAMLPVPKSASRKKMRTDSHLKWLVERRVLRRDVSDIARRAKRGRSTVAEGILKMTALIGLPPA